MRSSKFTEVEILQALREVQSGAPAASTCRRLGITQTTFYRWRKKYDVPQETEVHEVRRLRNENLRLKHIVADLLLEKLG